MKHRKIYCLALILLCVFLSACRSSPVLEQAVYVQDEQLVDMQQEMLEPDDEGEEDEDFSNVTEDEPDTSREEETNEGVEGDKEEIENSVDTEENQNKNLENHSEQAGNDDKSDNTSKNDDSKAPDSDRKDSSDNSSGDQGTAADDSDKSTDDNKDTTDPEQNDDSDNPDSGETPGENNPEADPGGDGGGSEPAEPGPTRQVTDASGNLVDVPENVNTVTACGAAAQMVEMLGGSGRLIGADSTLLDSSLASAAFSDIGSIHAWWSSSGSISSDNFSALLAAKPDVCFYLSGAGTFSDSQLEQLSEDGIAAVALYQLSSAANLENSAAIVGEVLGGDAVSRAADYKSWVENTISAVSGRAGSELTSLYISSWDSSAVYTIGDTRGVLDSSGSGLAVAYSRAKTQLMTTFMKAANVINESTRQNSHKSKNYVYVTPMFHDLSVSVSGDAAAYYDGSGEYAVSKDLFVSRQISGDTYYQLGGSSFPAIIVSSSSVKSAIENTWFWQYHETDESGYVVYNGQKFYCAIVGNYSIYVNPQGMLDWTVGSVESPLEAYWVACKIGGTYTIDEVKSKTSDFYQQFFGVSLSSGQLSAIFGE